MLAHTARPPSIPHESSPHRWRSCNPHTLAGTDDISSKFQDEEDIHLIKAQSEHLFDRQGVRNLGSLSRRTNELSRAVSASPPGSPARLLSSRCTHLPPAFGNEGFRNCRPKRRLEPDMTASLRPTKQMERS
jgi:hypothetical protein